MKDFKVSYKQDIPRKIFGVSIDGSLTSMNAINFKYEISRRVNTTSSNMEIDITALNALDLAGVNALVSVHKKLKNQGRILTIISGEEHPAYEFLHLTKFINLFNFQRA